MEKRLINFLGEGPYPFQEPEVQKAIELNVSDDMLIIWPKADIMLPQGAHAHNSYEFLIPFRCMPQVTINNKILLAEAGKIFSINPEQEHGTSLKKTNYRFLSFQITKDFFDYIASSNTKPPKIFLPNDSLPLEKQLNDLLCSFIQETRNKQAGYEFIQQSIVTQVIIHLLRLSNLIPSSTRKNCTEKSAIDKAKDFLHEHYNADFSLNQLAELVNLSPYYFIRVFKQYTGTTPYRYFSEVKINKAKELLKYTNHSITDICFICGFNNVSHFTTVFKKTVGTSPSVYRKASVT